MLLSLYSAASKSQVVFYTDMKQVDRSVPFYFLQASDAVSLSSTQFSLYSHSFSCCTKLCSQQSYIIT